MTCKVRTVEVNAVRLKELREDRALSTRELAKLAGVHHHTVLNLENRRGNAHPRTVRKLAAALGVEPRELRRRTADDGQ